MKIEKKKEKKKKKKKRKEKPKMIANRIAMLPYSTFERVPMIFYYANSC